MRGWLPADTADCLICMRQTRLRMLNKSHVLAGLGASGSQQKTLETLGPHFLNFILDSWVFFLLNLALPSSCFHSPLSCRTLTQNSPHPRLQSPRSSAQRSLVILLKCYPWELTADSPCRCIGDSQIHRSSLMGQLIFQGQGPDTEADS